MVAGQLLFKHSALELRGIPEGHSLVVAALASVPLYCALLLYAALTALWVYILTMTDLSRAYSFASLPLVLTPILAVQVFGETLNLSFYVGLVAIVGGLLIIAFTGQQPR